jgi:hypothetical protein
MPISWKFSRTTDRTWTSSKNAMQQMNATAANVKQENKSPKRPKTKIVRNSVPFFKKLKRFGTEKSLHCFTSVHKCLGKKEDTGADERLSKK